MPHPRKIPTVPQSLIVLSFKGTSVGENPISQDFVLVWRVIPWGDVPGNVFCTFSENVKTGTKEHFIFDRYALIQLL